MPHDTRFAPRLGEAAHGSVIDAYSDEITAISGAFPRRALAAIVDILVSAHDARRSVFVFGNGACAALASHMAADLGKSLVQVRTEDPRSPVGDRLRIMPLTDNAAIMTAIGNDLSYDDTFLEQLRIMMRPGDVVIGLSASGGSPNVLRAMQFARANGATTIGITGRISARPAIESLSDVVAAVPSSNIDVIEDFHVVYHHAITRAYVSAIRQRAEADALQPAEAVA